MKIDEETRKHLIRLQEEATEILSELSDIFPPEYYFTFIARNGNGIEDADIVLTTDALESSIEALERNKAKMDVS